MSITQEKLCVLGAQIVKWFVFEWLGSFFWRGVGSGEAHSGHQ